MRGVLESRGGGLIAYTVQVPIKLYEPTHIIGEDNAVLDMTFDIYWWYFSWPKIDSKFNDVFFKLAGG